MIKNSNLKGIGRPNLPQKKNKDILVQNTKQQKMYEI